MDHVPFSREDQLCDKLQITCDQTFIQRSFRSGQDAAAATKSLKEKPYLPGQPRIGFNDGKIGEYLESELATHDLNKLAPHLWLVATQDSSHISSLTHQIVRSRQVIITEKPELHLVWAYNRIFIKPIPEYLLSHAFWKFYLVGGHSPIMQPQKGEIMKAALGFLRSYLHLVRRKSDFIIATDEKRRLIPKHICYSDFINFILAFEQVEDSHVSPRYNFGELRLTRLNFWSKIFLRRFTYHKIHHQYSAHFAQFYAPLLFMFGVFSVLLNAMQVVLAHPSSTQPSQSWISFANVSRGFSVFTLVCVALMGLLLLGIFSAMFLREIIFALGDLYRQKTSKPRGTALRSVPAAKSMA